MTFIAIKKSCMVIVSLGTQDANQQKKLSLSTQNEL